MNTSETARDVWDKIAKEYDRTNTPTQMWVGNEVLRRAGVHSGMKVLDVAAGSGALSIPGASRRAGTGDGPVFCHARVAQGTCRKEGLSVEMFGD